MRVSNGHLNGLVPHEFLNGAEIHSSHHQTTGKRVAQTVPSEVPQPGLLDCGKLSAMAQPA